MHASVRIPSVIYNNFYFPLVFVTIPPHFLDSHLCIKSLLCSLQGFVNTVLCDCKTPASANLFPCDFPTHHEPCSTFGSMPWFCIFDGALASEGEHGGTVGRKRGAGFLCDVCCEITAVSPEETRDSSVWEHTQGFALACRGWTVFLILILPAAHPVLWSGFNVTSLHCISFIPFTSQSSSVYILTPTAKWVTSRWSRKPVGP